jgi:pimeloyl-ACP methyl ester carboxylesterase
MNIDNTPDTIMLVHGLWMTPRSWEKWVPYYQAKGYKVVTPTFPGFEIEVEALRENPEIIASLDMNETIAKMEAAIADLDSEPIIIGHSFGGTMTQLLLDRGHGVAGVAIDSAPPEGVHVTPLSQAKSLFPVLKTPANRHKAVGFTQEEFHYAFANTLSREESDAVHARYHIPASGRWVWDYGLLANFKPGHQDTWVNFKNEDRVPLLFIGGEKDHIMPPAVNKSNQEHYNDAVVTEYKEFPNRSHWICGETGWEEVADYALSWALQHAAGTKSTIA